MTTGGKAALPGPLTALSPPADTFYLDQFKNGISVGVQPVTQNRLVFGRAPDCDIQLEHPSISRYHAAVLWSPKNDDAYQKGDDTTSFWYLVDCGSTHGTVCNKVKVDTGKMIKLNPNNNVFKFGASTRFFILGSKEEDNDDDDDEPNSAGISHNANNKDSGVEDEGCTWGMQFAECDGEEEETGDSMALKSIVSAMKGGEKIESANQNAYSENPYRCIQQWFEREGQHFDFKVETINTKFKCNFELPIDGQWISIEGELANRKKDAINNACAKCCGILDHAQLLFPWQKQNAKSSRKSDLYDNEDGFDLIDETVGSKKKQKMSHETETFDNYDTLNAKWKTVNEELCKLKVKLATIGLEPGTKPEVPSDLTDSLDAFLAEMNKKKFGLSLNEKIEKSNLRIQIKQLEVEQSKIEKLIQIAKPPEVKIPTTRKPELEAKVKVISPKIESTTTSESVDAASSPSDVKPESNLSSVAVEQSALAVEATSEVSSTDKTDKVDESSLLSHHATGQMKPPTERVKVSVKQVRKQRQDSIVEAIEKEKKLEKERVYVSPESESDFIGWLPPVNQSGDGKTHLNDKYGY